MHTWFDIQTFDQVKLKELALTTEGLTTEFFDKMYDQGHMHESITRVLDIVKSEASALGDPKKVFLGGFSVGVSTALGAWIECNYSLGGLIGSSGVNCWNTDWDKVDVETKNKTPIFLYHGDEDPLFDMKYAQATYKLL
jgi:predicted esterase